MKRRNKKLIFFINSLVIFFVIFTLVSYKNFAKVKFLTASSVYLNCLNSTNRTSCKIFENERNQSNYSIFIPVYSNIALIQMISQERNKVYDESIKNKQKYALKQNYTFFFYKTHSETGRHPVWSKCLAILKTFKMTRLNDWSWMLDADTIITNFNIKLNHLTYHANRLGYHMIVTRDCNDLNAGSILFRNSQVNIFLVVKLIKICFKV